MTSYSFSWFDWFCLWYPPGWLILFNRHWQHYHQNPEGWREWEYWLFLVPGGFYLALLLRWLRLGCRSPQSVASHKIDPDYQQAFRTEILAPILKHHFQAELSGLENLPSEEEPLIVVLNHAGMCFPWDFLGLGLLLSQAQPGRSIQSLAHLIFFNHPWLNWWLPPGWSELLGGIPADRDSFSQAIAQQEAGSTLLYAPEGWRGLAKGWSERYHLATFDPSFIRLSLRYQTPILPVVCLGNEFLHPWAWNVKRFAHWFKLPMFPLSPLLLVFLFFPSMGVWANWTRLRYQIQPLYRPWEDVPAEGWQKHSVVYEQAQKLRSRLQDQINQLNQQQHQQR